MDGMYTDRRQSDPARRWAVGDMARLLLQWVVACVVIGLIGSPLILIRMFPAEMGPILVSAFAMMGIELASFCLWALAVGLPTVRQTLYGPLSIWPRKRRAKAAVPWFDNNGTMLWRHDGRGGWVRKMDAASKATASDGRTTQNSYR